MTLIPPATEPRNTNADPAAADEAVADALVSVAASRPARTTRPRIATSGRLFLSRICMTVPPFVLPVIPAVAWALLTLWHRSGLRNRRQRCGLQRNLAN